MTPPSSLRRRVVAALTAGAWTLAVPFAALATPANVGFTVTPYPHNADNLGPAFVTAGELAAFDIALQNTSGSTFTSVNLTSETSLPGTTYMGTIVTGGSAAGQVSCAPASAPAFSCSLGNLVQDATLTLRVVFDTPSLPGQLLDFTVTGKGSGASTRDPGNSRGDTFSGTATIELVPLFLNGAGERGAAEFIPSSMGAVIETAGMITSATNPAWTRVTVAAPGADAPTGTFGYLKEHDAGTPGFGCPAGASCFGQASEIQYLGGAEASTPFKVELRLDNAKASVSTPKKVTIYHVTDTLAVERPFDVTCTFAGDYPTNAPCGVSKATSADDKNDYVFIFWLDRNGYTRGG
ncbi:MAG: hypothetical protein ABI622_06310 [Chloroflexota bacterium]